MEVERQVLRLGESLDIAAVQALHAELNAAMAGGKAFVVDGSEVARVDTASLQVLAAMFMYVDQHKRDVTLQAPSQALAQTAELLGISDCIGLKVKEDN